MPYTDADTVREEAGLVNNANIRDGKIEPLIDEAHAEIQGRIGSRYSLSKLAILFDESQAQKLLGRIETLLSAGYLLQREYPQEDGENAEGDSRVKRAMDMLDAIVSGDTMLYDSAGTLYPSGAASKSGRSIETTAPAWDDEERPAVFSTTDHNEF